MLNIIFSNKFKKWSSLCISLTSSMLEALKIDCAWVGRLLSYQLGNPLCNIMKFMVSATDAITTELSLCSTEPRLLQLLRHHLNLIGISRALSLRDLKASFISLKREESLARAKA